MTAQSDSSVESQLTNLPAEGPFESSSRFRFYGFALIGFAMLVRLVVAWSRYLQVDEMQLLHLGWLRSAGERPGVDYSFPQFSLLIDLAEGIWRILGSSLRGVYLFRSIQWGVGATVILLTGVLALRIAGRSAAVLAMIAISFMTDFSDRVIEFRSDSVLILLMLTAIILIQTDSRLALLLSGAMTGLAFTFNFKAFLMIPFLGLAILLHVWSGERWRRFFDHLLAFAAGLGLVLLSYLLYLTARGDLQLFAETIVRNLQVSAAPISRVSPIGFFETSFLRNSVFYALTLAGVLGVAFRRYGRRSYILAAPLLFTIVYVIANPTFFPYNFVDVAPVWAVFAGMALQRAFQIRNWAGWLLVVLVVAFPTFRFVSLAQTNSLAPQLEANRIVMAVVPSDERVYDTAGLILFRKGPYYWRLHSLMMPRYWQGEFRISQELWRYHVRLVVPSYRTGWLSRSDRAFLGKAFPLVYGKVGVTGWIVAPSDWRGGRAAFPIASTGMYRIYGSGAPRVSIDGKQMTSQGLWLESGRHEISVEGGNPAAPVAVIWTHRIDMLSEFPSPEMLYFPWTF